MTASNRFPRTHLARALTALGLGLAASLAHAEPLPTVVDKVLLQQPSVRSAQALLRAADAQMTQVRSDFLPSLGVAYRGSHSRDETLGAPIDRNVRRTDGSLRWNIFNGATDTYRLRSAAFARDAADADLDNVLEQVAYEITENYSDVVRLRQLMASLDATIASQERVEANVARRVEAGRIPSAELDLIHVRLIQNRTVQGQLRAQLGTAEYRYRLLTGQAPDAHLVTPSLIPADSPAGIDPVDALVDHIQDRNPRLRAARQRAASRQADVGAARGLFFPSVDLSFNKRLDNTTIPVPTSDTQHAAQVQVSLDIPLGGKNLGRHTEAVERQVAAQADADDLLLKVSKDITDLYRQYTEARLMAPQLEERITAAQRVAAAYELHFEAGRRSLNDLSIAQGDLFDAQRNLIENRAQQLTLQAQLLGMAGELRDALRSRYRAAPIPAELLGTTYVPPALVAAPVPVAEAAPAPQVELAPAAAPSDTPEAAVRQRVDAWLAAWTKQDFDAYRASYRSDFQPGKGRSTADWEAERRQRVTQAQSPQIRIEQLKVLRSEPERVVLRFTQHYTAARYHDSVRKELEWQKVDGQWKIARETVRASLVSPSN